MTSIRAPRADDAGDLAAVHVRSWQVAYRGDFATEFLDGLDVDRRTAWFGSRIADDPEGLLVAESDGRVVGFCLFGETAEGGRGEIFALYVDPPSWGDGHGHRLIEASEEALAAAGHDRLVLWVLESNQRARGFYERHGWAVGKPVRIEEIGGRQVTEVCYEKTLP